MLESKFVFLWLFNIFLEMVIVFSSSCLINLDSLVNFKIDIEYFKIVKKGGGYKGKV